MGKKLDESAPRRDCRAGYWAVMLADPRQEHDVLVARRYHRAAAARIMREGNRAMLARHGSRAPLYYIEWLGSGRTPTIRWKEYESTPEKEGGG